MNGASTPSTTLFAGFHEPARGEEAARRFCALIGRSEPCTFEGYFSKADPRGRNNPMPSVRHTGAFDDILPELRAWQNDGRNVYMRVNTGGSKSEEITGVRAVSIEFDADEMHHKQCQPLPERWHVPPSLIVRRGKSVHAHWLVADCPVERFKEIQHRLQEFYRSDPNALGVQRIWRCPGFRHPLFPEQDVELLVRDVDDWELDYFLADLMVGLPGFEVDSTKNELITSGAETKCSEPEFREVLSFIDPTFADDFNRWVGLAKAIRFGQIPLKDADKVDWLPLLTDWCSGELWRQRTGDTEFTVSSYPGLDQVLRDCGNKPRSSGRQFTLYSFVKLAEQNGYAGQLLSAIERRTAVGPSGAGSLGCNSLGFVFGKSGQLLRTFQNALTAAQLMEATPERNEFSHRIGFRDTTLPWGEAHGRDLNEESLRAIRSHYIEKFDLDVSKDHVVEAISTVAGRNRFHPVKDYLESLVWDGQKRLDRWLIDICGAADTEFARAAGRKFLLGAVTRIMRPGCKFDYVLALEGPQGIGKSSVFRILASDEYFADSLPSDLSKPDTVQALQGKWIVEMPELEGLSRGEVTQIKAFLSRQTDRARFAYERLSEDYDRSCVFGATTNEAGYLRDSTGQRRFWPVAVGGIDLDLLRALRDQLWAEAYAAYKSGEKLELPPELAEDARRAQEERYTIDPWEESLRHYLGAQKLSRVHSATLLSDALAIQRGLQSQTHARRLRNLMEQRLGWSYSKSVRINGVNTAGYVRNPELQG